MNKKTKLVAVLSASAILALGASQASFAAGWEKDSAGVWHYYDKDDEMVTGSWQKDGNKFFYLDDDGNMKTNGWVDDEHYVGSDGAMLVNQWVKTSDSDDSDSSAPGENDEHWYYFGTKGKKVTDGSKKINGKTYYFDSDGKMQYGWYQKGDDIFYLGTEDQGWRVESKWLWLQNPGEAHDENDEDSKEISFKGENCTGDTDSQKCESEGWYYFQNSGKLYTGASRKKINGSYFMFNGHGQMLYEWIDGDTKVTRSSNANLDGNLPENATRASIDKMYYFTPNGEGKADGGAAKGWFEITGSRDLGTDDDTDWYWVKNTKGEIMHAGSRDANGLTDEGKDVYRKKEKISWNGKTGTFAFDENGRMKTGLQYIGGHTYYFDGDGYMKTGKISNLEEDDNNTYYYSFKTKKGGSGQGVDGVDHDTLYFQGKRLEAQDDNRVFKIGNKFYLVNKSGKIQKSKTKKYNIETVDGNTYSKCKVEMSGQNIKSAVDEDGTVLNLNEIAEVPHIELLDNWMYPNANGAVGIMPKQDGADTLTPAALGNEAEK